VRRAGARQNATTIALVAVDCVGLFHDELEAVRARLDPALGVDYVIVTSLHDHNAPDTIGGWGPDELTNGVNKAWRETLRDKMAEAIADAVRALEPSVMTAGSIRVEDPGPDVEAYVSDTRDPVVIDDRLHALRFDTPDGELGEAWGRSIGRFAVAAFDPARGASVVTDPTPRLRMSATRFDVHVDSLKFQLAGRLGVFERTQGGTEDEPTIPTELAYVRIGDQVSFVTIPGESLPELWLGGYDGADAFNYPFIDPAQPNAPDPTKAPRPPYLRDLLAGAPEHRMVFGVAQDFVGYIIPPYNFVLSSDGVPYLNEAPGDHYEETSSLGPRAAAEIVGTARQLVEADGR
jgi:hypothetical protein